MSFHMNIMDASQMKLVHIAPMHLGNGLMQSVGNSPAKLVLPAQQGSSYTMLPVQTPMERPVRGTKRAHPERKQGSRSKKRAATEGAVNSQNCGQFEKPLSSSVARRNERERNRVKQVNLGFENLRHHVPNAAKNKKMSKVDTLRAAADYIKQLQTILTDTDQVIDSAFQDNAWSVLQSAQALADMETPIQMEHSPQQTQYSPSHSADCMPSPGGYSTDGSGTTGTSDTHVPQDDHEFLDFSSWFQ